MIPVLTTEDMVEVDRLMIEHYGIVLIQMMENAGRNLAEQARRMLAGDLSNKGIVVLAGMGNNGGGGLVAARHLHNWGAEVLVQLVGDLQRMKEIPAHQLAALQAMGIPGAKQACELPLDPDLVIDAIIGYGLQGNPREDAARWIVWAGGRECPILALDAPSGLNTTTGIPGTPCIVATTTLTLALPKTGLLTDEARSFVGELLLADISVPPELYRQMGIEPQAFFSKDTIVSVK